MILPWLTLAAMVIAVHDHLKERKKNSPEHRFIRELIKTASLNHPQDQFYLIGSHNQTENTENLKFIGVEEPRFPLLRKKRYGKSIAKELENIRADQMILNDEYYCKETDVPQILIVHERFDLKKYEKTDLENAKSLVVLNESTKAELIATYQVDPQKIMNVHFGISDEIQPLNFEEQFIVKEDHTEGKEYFLAPYPHNKNILISLLKGFSIFKKRQQTNMMLLMISNDREVTDSFYSLIQNYKYREDVILKYQEETRQSHNLLGAAYAFIDPSPESLIPVAEAMKSGIPVITVEKAREQTGNAALYMEIREHQQMAEQMMLIYKDENLRGELIKKAGPIASEYTWERTAQLFWNALEM